MVAESGESAVDLPGAVWRRGWLDMAVFAGLLWCDVVQVLKERSQRSNG